MRDVIANSAAEIDLTLGPSGRRSLREPDRSTGVVDTGNTTEPLP